MRLATILLSLCFALCASHVVAAPGTLDLTFATDLSAGHWINAIAEQEDGKIVIGGSFPEIHGRQYQSIARLHPDGSLDESFNPGTGVNGEVMAVALQPDGKVLLGGVFTAVNNISRNGIARLNQDGSVDEAFNANADVLGSVRTTRVTGGGKILVGGSSYNINGSIRLGIFRLNSDGTSDASFDAKLFLANVTALTEVADAKMVISGTIGIPGSNDYSNVIRLGSDGTVDLGFQPVRFTGPNVTGAGQLTVQSDRKLLLAGLFSTCNGVPRNCIVRLNPDGTVDHSFDPGSGPGSMGLPYQINGLALQRDGRIIVGGHFTTFNGVPCGHIARLNANGSLDTTFNPGTGANASRLASVHLQRDGRILIGGDFSQVNGTARDRIARLWGNPVLSSKSEGSKFVFQWTDPSFVLQTSTALLGNYLDVPDGSSPFTNSLSGTQQFFRLIAR